MKYLCLLYGNQQKVSQLPKEEFEALVDKCKQHDAELHRTGAVRTVESLEWDVTTVCPKDGKPTVIDGPFVETRDVVGSFMVIEARDLNDADPMPFKRPSRPCTRRARTGAPSTGHRSSPCTRS